MNETYFDSNNKKDCNGCGVCAYVCPKKCIKMEEDTEGFLYPSITKNECIKCNKCKIFCSNFNLKEEENEISYLAKNISKEELEFSSSGGIFYILARYTINKKGVVFGVYYNQEMVAVHDYAETFESCKKFSGSKYVRSDLKDSYIYIKDFLNQNRIVLFTGTACQIAGLKKYLNKDYSNLILCDILCHANPSPKVFAQYLQNLKIIYKKKVTNVAFRSKETGWRNQVPIIYFDDDTKIQENSYFRSFVLEMINRPSCNSCVFASKRRISDFTIGDFWGIENILPNYDDSNGVSLLTVNSIQGEMILNEIKDQMELIEINYKEASDYNHYQNVMVHKKRNQFFEELSNNKINETNIIKYMKKYTQDTFHKRAIQKVKRNVKKILKVS